MKKMIKYIASIVGIMALLGGLIGVNTAVQSNNKEAETSQISSEQSARLDIALVNEDKTIESGERLINLGSSYIKTIERDDSQNWYVVSRGTAEKGIEDGSYQLAVTIPSDFSSKILDLDSLVAEQAVISYRINAGGNQQIELEAERIGNNIVSDLNSRLINMYIAGVLSNLRTAQRNVKILTEQETGNIEAYEAQVLSAANAFPEVFTSISATADNSISSGQNLQNGLSYMSEFLGTLEQSGQTADQGLSSLIEQRSQDAISYEEFIEALLVMNESALALDLSNVLSYLESTQSALEDTAASIAATDTSKETLGNVISSLEEQTTILQNSISGMEEGLDQTVEEAIQTLYPDIEDGKELTVYDLLMLEKKNTNLDTEDSYLENDPDEYAKWMENYENQVKQMVENALNQLPCIDATELPLLAADMTELDPNAADEVLSFDPLAVAAYDVTVDDSIWTELVNRKEDLINASTISVAPSYQSAEDVTAEIRVEAADPSTGLTINSWSYGSTVAAGDEAQEVYLPDGEGIEITFSYPDPTLAPVEDQIIVSIGQIAINVELSQDAYTQAAVSYAELVQSIRDSYRTAQNLLNLMPSDDLTDSLENFFGQSGNELLKTILHSALADQQEKYSETLTEQLTALQTDLADLKEQEEDLNSRIIDLQSETEKTMEALSEQLSAVSELQSQIDPLNSLQQTATTALQSSDSDLSSYGTTLSDLLTTSSELRASSDSTVSEADAVALLFENFENEVTTAQGKSTELSEEADFLMEQFAAELQNSSLFSDTFGNVLSNLYDDGVINESMVEFLSDPVEESASSIQATVNVYRPFTWILLMEIVSLFTAYLFSAYNLTRKVKDRFQINRFLETDWINTLVIFLLSLVIGIMIGVGSASSLSLPMELMPTWVLTVTLYQLLLTELQYFLLKNLKAVGMGLSFFMTISFVYLSSSVGTTAVLDGGAAVLKRINILSIVENVLSRYFDGQQIGFGMIFLVMMATAALMVLNIFVTIRLNEMGKAAHEG